MSIVGHVHDVRCRVIIRGLVDVGTVVPWHGVTCDGSGTYGCVVSMGGRWWGAGSRSRPGAGSRA